VVTVKYLNNFVVVDKNKEHIKIIRWQANNRVAGGPVVGCLTYEQEVVGSNPGRETLGKFLMCLCHQAV